MWRIQRATDNPFTYRGYYYDKDLDLYRLGTRYYDARMGRFINVLLSCFLFRNSENKIKKIAISVFVLFYLTALIGVIFYKLG